MHQNSTWLSYNNKMDFARRFTIFFVSLSMALVALAACQSDYKFQGGGAINPPQPAADFTLKDIHGAPFRLAAQQGKIVLLYFGYTHCADACPMTLANLARVRKALGADAAQVEVVFVTTDPERDTSEVMQKYLANFDPTFVGLRGDWADVSPILQKYFGSSAKQLDVGTSGSYSVDHTTFIYVIDRKLQWRVLFAPNSKIEDMVSDLRYLLQSS